jgi:hypothetical protein
MGPSMTRLLLTTLAVFASAAGPASAALAEPPMTLPGDAHAAGVLADRDTWIVAARHTNVAAALSRR